MQYPKIQTVFKRDPENHYKTLLMGEYSLPEFEYLADCDWLWTEKLDGMNTRCLWDSHDVAFKGRTDRAQMPVNLMSFLQETITREKMRGLFGGDNVCVFGEGYGAGIQKGGKYSDKQKLVLFDINIGGWWLAREDLEGIANGLGIEIVPIVATGTLHKLVDCVREGFKSQWGDFIAEGIVAKPLVALKARDGSRIITKLKHSDFAEGK